MAPDPSISFLATIDEMQQPLEGAGFTPVVWDNLTEGVLAWAQAQAARPATVSVPAIGLHLLAPDIGVKFANQVRKISEGRVRFLRAVLTR